MELRAHAVLNLLDSRVRSFYPFRNPNDGTTSKKVTSLSRTAYSSAEVRVLHLFIWSHALGSKALILKPQLRANALSSLRSLQIMCYSVRAKLPFTADEHRSVGHIATMYLHDMADISA